MKSASLALIAILDSDHFIMADLVTITLVSGNVHRFTNADQAITYGGNTYTPWPLERGGVSLRLGVQVDSLQLTLYGGINEPWEGMTLPGYAQNGGFDGARVSIDRAFMATFGDTSAGVVNIFSGRVSEAQPSRTQTVLTIHSDLELLNIKLPRFVYQAACRNTLYDVGCTVNKASYAASGTVTSGSTRTVINSGVSGAANYYTLGVITFDTGDNTGQSRTVKAFSSGQFVLMSPLLHDPTAGDTFTAYPGCDLRSYTCNHKFSNIGQFGGVPYIPTAETGA